MLPDILWELGDSDGDSWRTRVVPNKYPAITPDAPSDERSNGLYRSRGGRGHQEVIIDTPYHYQTMAHMSVDTIDAVLQTYLARYHHYRRADGSLFPHLFRNHGADAGGSLPHPHSQLIATPLPPPNLQREEAQAKERYREMERCPYCAIIDKELQAETRLVFANDEFAVFVPYAAPVPCAQWILPRTHEAEFGRLDATQRWALAEALREATGRLHHAFGDPDYNLFVRTALDYESDAPHLHWSIRIHPRTTMQAGFELSTGLQINPSLPERDAEMLRAVSLEALGVEADRS